MVKMVKMVKMVTFVALSTFNHELVVSVQFPGKRMIIEYLYSRLTSGYAPIFRETT